DKMRLFVDDMSAIGQSLDKAQDNYRQAMKKLSSGRGNVLSQAEAFRSLGVEIKREINPELAEQATTQDEEYRLRSVPETQQDASYPDGEAVNQQSN
ncbi:MAG: DNA recombination protein RmuC, partial [Citrobacter freundii]|nr:DNA recombination protein RmuC [Citrobacter freundii]